MEFCQNFGTTVEFEPGVRPVIVNYDRFIKMLVTDRSDSLVLNRQVAHVRFAGMRSGLADLEIEVKEQSGEKVVDLIATINTAYAKLWMPRREVSSRLRYRLLKTLV